MKQQSTQDVEASRSPSASSARRRIAFRLLAILLGLIPFVVLEISLRAFDIGRPTGYRDPYVGFSKLHPQFEKNEEKKVYETTQARQLFFGRQEFSIEKPQNGFRVFCLGGSTVRGRPYTTETAFARWMQIELAATDPERKYEIVNCGGLSYASYRLVPMLQEVLTYQPDAIVIATGHNEFLEDRTYRNIKSQSGLRRWFGERLHSLRTVTTARQIWDRWRGSDHADDVQQLDDRFKTRLDAESGYASYHRDDDDWRDRVVRHYEQSLRAMVHLCREKNIPLILVRLGSNLRDCPPFKHEPKPYKSKEGLQQEREWRAAFEQASIEEQTDLEQALKLYLRAEELDGEHALVCYRIARIYDRLKQYEKAKTYYLKAKDYDVCPLRMLESMSEIVEKIAKETETPLVDARTLFEQQSPQGIPGNNLFMDHVHPTIEGHQWIGREIVKRMREEKIAPSPTREWSSSNRRQAYAKHFSSLSPGYLGEAIDRVTWLENWARRDRLRRETLPNSPRGYLHFGHREADFGKEEAAWREYGALLQNHEDMKKQLIQRTFRLFQQGRTQAAEDLLDRLRFTLTGKALSEVYFALTAIALETGDSKSAEKIAREHAAEFTELPADSPWKKAFPDMRSRLEKLAKSAIRGNELRQ
ncbi:MAG: hypothetical protein Tsb009_25330 [Planctomycetaceae bacterium]